MARADAFAITHRNIQGDVAPMLGITAHQFSRGGLDACLKAERHHDISAFLEYSEIEKSADLLFSCLMTSDMKTTRQMRLQHLKNWDGAVIAEPTEVFIDFQHGLRLTDIEERTTSELAKIIHTLHI